LADQRRRHETRVTIEPAREDHSFWKSPGFSGEIGKHHLGDVLGQMNIAIGQSECRRINEVNVTKDKLPEGVLRSFVRVLSQELSVIQHALDNLYKPPNSKSDRIFQPVKVLITPE
jgi:hypothetical protein